MRKPARRAMCLALFLIASITFQGFPSTQARIVFDVRANLDQQSKPQKKSTAVAAPQRPPAPSVAPPVGPQAGGITATNRDEGWPNYGTNPEPNPGPASTGDTVTYHVAINNSGANATGVVFTDVIDPNQATLVGVGTIEFSAIADTYSSIGNVGINSANLPNGSGHTGMDNETLNGGTLTGFGNSLGNANGTAPNGSNTVTTTNTGTVLLNADGTFTYNPAAGFTGADLFFYTLTKGNSTATAQLTINVSNMIWFVNAGAGGTHDGTLANPFSCLTGGAGCFSNVNDNGAGHPKDNDNVFMYSGNYTGGLTPRNGQKLIGQGASASLASIAVVTPSTESNTLPTTGGTNPVVTTVAASTNGINIGVGFSNTLRGFTIGNTTGAKIASGANFGTLTVGNNTTPDMTLSGNGQALNLTSGNFDATSKFSSVATTSSPTSGLTLTTITGTVAFGSTTVSGNNNECLIATALTGNINFGNTSCTGGGNGVSLSADTAGVRTFGTLSVTGGSGNAFVP